MRKIIKSFITFSIIIPMPLVAASNVGTLKNRISKYNRKINLLVAKINDLEKRINLSNDKYISRVKSLESMTEEIEGLKSSLYITKDEISVEQGRSVKAFNYYLLEKLDKNSDNFLQQKVYADVLKAKIVNLSALKKDSEKKIKELENLETSFSSFKTEEESLYKLIVSLEDQKKLASQSYIDLMEKKNTDESELDSAIAKLKAKKKIYKKIVQKRGTPFKFKLPIESFISAKKSKQGITLAYKETEMLKAPYAGKVVYTGKLSSYGNVIILDHGQDVRTVLLGDISIKVKKGETVQADQVMGYTVSDLGTTKNLYFEVRKKDVAQNTALWLNENSKIKKI